MSPSTMSPLRGLAAAAALLSCTSAVSPASLAGRMSADPASAQADGSDAVTVAVDVAAPEHAAAGLAVVFSAGSAPVRLVQVDAALDANGHAEASYVSEVAGNYVISAEVSDPALGAKGGTLNLQQAVTFVAEDAAAAKGPPTLTVAVSPNSLPADGKTRTSVTVTGKAADGKPLASHAVQLSTQGGASGSDQWDLSGGVFDARGSFRTQLRSTEAGSRRLLAACGSVTASADLAFTPGPVAASRSLLAVANLSIAANGLDALPTTLEARDRYGNATPGQGVALSVDAKTAEVRPTRGTTDANGQLAFGVFSTVAGPVKVTAAMGNVTVFTTATFASPVADAGKSSLTAPAQATVADGNQAATVVASLRDAAGRAVARAPVAWSAPGAATGVAVRPQAAATDANGNATASVTSTLVGAIGISAQGANATLNGNVPFVSGALDASQCTLVASPNGNLLADTNAKSTLSVVIRDARGNAVSGENVTVSAASANVALTPQSGPTDANGLFVATATSSRAGAQAIAARAGAYQGNASVTFVAGPADANASLLGIVPNGNVLADGNFATSVTLMAADAYNNRIGGQGVTLSCSPNCQLSPASVTTDASGAANTTLAASEIGRGTLTATVGAANLTLPLTFVSPLPAASIVLSPNTIGAGGNVPVTVTLRLADEGNQTLANQPYRLMGAVPGMRFDKATGASDANGAAQAHMTSLYAGVQPVRATFGGRVLNANLTVTGTTASCANGTPFVRGQTWLANPNWLPRRMALADFNEDGRPDLAYTSETGTPFFAVHLNDGNDRFLPAKTYASVGYQYGIAAADFTGDGHVDILTASNDHAYVTLFVGAGNGNFVKRSNVAVGSGPYDLVAADFDGDGLADAAVTNASDHSVTMLWGAGNGNFTTQALMTDNVPHGLAHGFVDGDAQRDLVVACSNTDGNGINVFLGQGSRTFASRAAYAPGVAADYVAVGDLTGDGYADVAVSVQQSNGLLTFASSASGTLSLNGNYPSKDPAPSALALADLDGDGTLDVLQAQTNASRTALWHNAGNGILQSPNFAPGGQPIRDIAVFAAAGGNVPTLVSLHGSGSVAFVANVDAPYARSLPVEGQFPRDFVVADFDNDGIADVFVANFVNPSPLHLGTTAGGLEWARAPKSQLSLSDPGLVVRAADLDGDGNLDLVVGTTSAYLNVFLGKGDGTFAARQLSRLASAFRAMRLVDWDNDGLLDLVAISGDSDGALFVSNGHGDATFSSSSRTACGSTPYGLAIADFDLDGAPDAAVANNGESNNVIFFGKGDGSIRRTDRYPSDRASFGIAAIDFNGDGYADLFNTMNGEVVTLLNRRDGTFAQKRLFRITGNNTSISLLDWNGDGLADVVAAAAGDDAVSVYVGDGTGNVADPLVFTGSVSDFHAVHGVDAATAGRPALVFVGSDQPQINVLQPDACP